MSQTTRTHSSGSPELPKPIPLLSGRAESELVVDSGEFRRVERILHGHFKENADSKSLEPVSTVLNFTADRLGCRPETVARYARRIYVIAENHVAVVSDSVDDSESFHLFGAHVMADNMIANPGGLYGKFTGGTPEKMHPIAAALVREAGVNRDGLRLINLDEYQFTLDQTLLWVPAVFGFELMRDNEELRASIPDLVKLGLTERDFGGRRGIEPLAYRRDGKGNVIVNKDNGLMYTTDGFEVTNWLMRAGRFFRDNRDVTDEMTARIRENVVERDNRFLIGERDVTDSCVGRHPLGYRYYMDRLSRIRLDIPLERHFIPNPHVADVAAENARAERFIQKGVDRWFIGIGGKKVREGKVSAHFAFIEHGVGSRRDVERLPLVEIVRLDGETVRDNARGCLLPGEYVRREGHTYTYWREGVDKPVTDELISRSPTHAGSVTLRTLLDRTNAITRFVSGGHKRDIVKANVLGTAHPMSPAYQIQRWHPNFTEIIDASAWGEL